VKEKCLKTLTEHR